MPRHFNCVFGDCMHIALQEPKSFVVTDAHGRDWICYPVKEAAREQAEPFLAAHAVGDRLGLMECGTCFTTLLTRRKTLPAALGTISLDCLDEA